MKWDHLIRRSRGTFSRSLPLPALAKNVPLAHFLNASRLAGEGKVALSRQT